MIAIEKRQRTKPKMIVLAIVFGSFVVGLHGCRSQLPPDQPSRLHEVYQSQSVRYR
ncbi:MAG: hypothetical protein MUD03_03155 [Pirellula sp.]|nr:hypothetical protein [Pirellula sp.]